MQNCTADCFSNQEASKITLSANDRFSCLKYLPRFDPVGVCLSPARTTSHCSPSHQLVIPLPPTVADTATYRLESLPRPVQTVTMTTADVTIGGGPGSYLSLERFRRLPTTANSSSSQVGSVSVDNNNGNDDDGTDQTTPTAQLNFGTLRRGNGVTLTSSVTSSMGGVVNRREVQEVSA